MDAPSEVNKKKKKKKKKERKKKWKRRSSKSLVGGYDGPATREQKDDDLVPHGPFTRHLER